jgi:hypothetical protein
MGKTISCSGTFPGLSTSGFLSESSRAGNSKATIYKELCFGNYSIRSFLCNSISAGGNVASTAATHFIGIKPKQEQKIITILTFVN